MTGSVLSLCDHLCFRLFIDTRNTMTSEDEAKQLDSVTDRVQEKELDESRATQALGALSATTSADSASRSTFFAKKEDVGIIMDELEVTEDEAVAALRAAAAEEGEDGKPPEGQQLVAAALRRLVLS
jgi:NACalpha-BTF3-like transcription factor